MSTDTRDTDSLSDDGLPEEETEDVLQEVERNRTHRGLTAIFVALVGVTFSAFQMWIAARGYQFEFTLPVAGEVSLVSLQPLQVFTIHVTFALVLAFLLYPPTRGDGPLSRRLGAIEPAARDLFGADSPVTRATERLGDVVRWLAVDPSLNRITPLDVLLLVLSLLPAVYVVGNFDQIRNAAVFGIHSTPPVQEVYPWLPGLETLVTGLAAVGSPFHETSYAFVVGVLGILLVLEATRRALGGLLMGLVAGFIVYARWGYLVPRDSALGVLSIQPESWGNIVYNLWFTTEAGVMSTPVSVSVRFIYIFILFGAFLEMSGAGKWFIDLAYSLTGTKKGGPAKASVVSSGFMGMLSGSSIANTVTTGAFTIPLMKRSGYTPEFAGAVESSASSGGQILPPVMGAAAFLIMELTGTPFAEVIIAATLPAIAFFFGMWVMVHFEAARGGIGGLSREELPDALESLRTGWFYLVPIVLLLYFLVIARFSVNRAGWYTIVSIVALIAVVAAYNERTRAPLVGTITVLSLFQAAAYLTTGAGVVDAVRAAVGASSVAAEPYSIGEAAVATASDLGTIIILVSLAFLLATRSSNSPLLELDDDVDEAARAGASAVDRPSLSSHTAYRFGTFILKSMDSGARTATTVVVAVAAAGIVPGVISVTGLGPNLAALIGAISGGSMLALLTLTGIAAILFGMGMPTTAMYIILVAMLETPLVDAGIGVLAAHLFVLYFGLMADVTPPVAVAAFAAAGVAKAEELKTATTAFLLSLNKILVPFAFVFSPGILLVRDGEVIGWSDVADVGFFTSEVLVPVVGMFLGVYALGVTIIGYQYADVDSLERGLYSLSSILLMVPEIPLLIVEGLLGLLGIPSALTIFTITASLRGVGLAMLVGLTYRNRSRESPTSADADVSTPAAGDV
ncbi:TRAP transporter, 4TM/12TM fusion protein [Halobiforma haloterrestris]|uniref:TRAP transporter, 4TM/12TM fusion protein n=1 Tax=Natronobacterium haloterrestre TaxID=148448 RepID=A0A1I1GWT7_NATHA|nr:TRAP transporter fused permease subunit [Halobiforma haloterrestris]SFC16144.1 TRAP transporter, 4TM/12TM fusion protein [Halobiforma haloterrestris]